MSIAKIIKVLAEGEPFVVNAKKYKGLLKSASAEEAAEVQSIIKSRFDFAEEGEDMVFRTKTTSREGITTRGTQSEAAAAKTSINLGGIPDPQSKIGADLNTSSYVSSVIMPEHLRLELPKLNETRRILSVNAKDDYWTTLPEKMDFENKKIGGRIKGGFSPPSTAAGELGPDLVTRSTLSKLQEDKLNKMYGERLETIVGSLNSEELKNWKHILAIHNDKEKAFRVVNEGFELEGQLIPASRSVQDSVLATRELTDHRYSIVNASAVRQNIKNGARLLDGESIVKEVNPKKVKNGTPIGDKVWTKDLEEQGYRIFKLDPENGTGVLKKSPKKDFTDFMESSRQADYGNYRILSPAETSSRIGDIPQSFRILPYRQGYSPIKYTQPWAVTKLRLDKEGRVVASRIATARSRGSAEQGIERLISSKTEPNEAYFAHRSYEDGMDIAMDNDLPHIVDKFSAEEMKQLDRALKGLGFVDKDIDRLRKFNNFFSHRQDTTTMRRGQRLVDADTLGTPNPKNAATLPADEAIAVHLNTGAKYAAHAESFSLMEKAYVKEFGGFLKKGDTWDGMLDKSKRAHNGRTFREAYFVQQQLKRIEGRLSTFDANLDNHVTDIVEGLGKTKGGMKIERFIDTFTKTFKMDMPQVSISQGAAMTKSFMANAALGLGNLSQIGMQGTAMLNVLGMHGVRAAAAMGDVLTAFAPAVLDAPRLFNPKLPKYVRTGRSAELYKLIEDSGFVSGFDFVTLNNSIQGKGTLLGSRIARRLASKHLLPYQMGEGGVRAAAWFAEHRNMLSAIKKGKSAFKKSDVGSPAYLNEISKRAMGPALNMSRMNQPLVARGLFGMPLQFQQFIIQQVDFMLKEKSLLQHLGVLGAWTGAFGMMGIPFLQDALMLSEQVALKVAGPQALGWWQRRVEEFAGTGADLLENAFGEKTPENTQQILRDWITGGVIPAATDGMYTFAHRAGTARYISDMMMAQSIDDAAFGPGYQVMKLILGNSFENMGEVYEVMKGDKKFTTNLAFHIGTRQLEGLTGLHNVAAAIEAYHRGELRDRNLRLISNDPTLSEVMSFGMGFGVGEQQERYRRIFDAKSRQDTIRKWMWDSAEKIAKQSVDDPEGAAETFNEKHLQVLQYNPALAPVFLQVSMKARIPRMFEASHVEVMQNMMKYNKYLSQQEAEGYNAGLKRQLER